MRFEIIDKQLCCCSSLGDSTRPLSIRWDGVLMVAAMGTCPGISHQ